MKQAIIEAHKISKTYPAATEPVLDQLGLSVYQGDFTVIMGPSGAGKSTLLYALSGMDSISSGSVLYRGAPMELSSEKKMAQLRSREFGFVFQQVHLVSNLTLLENVAVAGYLNTARTKKETDALAEELLEKMNVSNAKNRLPSQASGGEAQRAAIARAAINRPAMLFADEPTGALNRRNSQEVLDLLTALNREGQSILMVTHDIRSAMRGNRILYLEDGRIPDVLELPPYEETGAREREESITRWLTALSW